MNNKYAMAYVEVSEIIKCLGKGYLEKLPRKLIDFFENNKANDYNYNIEDFKKQKVLKETLGILSMLELRYLATDEEKKDLLRALNENERRYQEEARKKYDPNKLFDKKKIIN